MTKKLSDSMIWAAANVPFESLKAMPKTLGALKETLDGFHDAPAGAAATVTREERNALYGYSSVGDKRWKLFKAAFDAAKKTISDADSGLLSVSLMSGPRDVKPIVDGCYKFSSNLGHGLDAIDRTLSGAIFDSNGNLASEHAGALVVAASRMLQVTITEIEAHIEDVNKKIDAVDTSSR